MTSSDTDGAREHATCILVGEAGVLIRGSSGSGKSTLARQTIERADAAGGFARLVSDDRVRLKRMHGRIVAIAEPAIAGLIEIRGIGVVRMLQEEAARVMLVVDCQADAPRYPDDADRGTEVLGIRLPRIIVGSSNTDRVGLVLWQLRALNDTVVTIS